MKFNDLDEIIKKGIKESENRNEFHILQAQSRIWEAIELPKKTKTIHWGFVFAIAASLSLFIISTILFLKLDSQQKELESLQAYLKEEKSSIEVQRTIAAIKSEPEREQEPITIPETVPILKPKENSPLAFTTKTEEKEVDSKNIDEELNSIPEVIVIGPELELVIPEIAFNPFTAELIILQDGKKEFPSEPRPKTQRKLKIKFGNSNHVLDQQNSLAFNIKL
jgi:hypothetical protein